MLFRNKKRDATQRPEQDREEVELHISDTGRVWVKPEEVVRTRAFRSQLDAVKQLREAHERAAAAPV